MYICAMGIDLLLSATFDMRFGTVPTMFRQCDIVFLSFYYTTTIDATTRLINHLNVHLSNNSKSVSGKISMERKITNPLSLVGGSNFEYHNV